MLDLPALSDATKGSLEALSVLSSQVSAAYLGAVDLLDAHADEDPPVVEIRARLQAYLIESAAHLAAAHREVARACSLVAAVLATERQAEEILSVRGCRSVG